MFGALVFSPFLGLAAEAPDAMRVREIAAWLPAEPAGFGFPITNREMWEKLALRHPELTNLISQAVKLAAEPLPAQPDSLYLEFSKNGNRSRWQKVAGIRRERIQVFTLAECLENKGRFLAPLERTIGALCAERTWVLPAHDGRLENFSGDAVDIDLGASGLGVELATASYLLGDRLSPATRTLVRENLERRIFGPYRAAVNGSGKGFWWMHGHNNWNAVCLDAVTGAALATIGPAQERAWFIAVAEQDIGAYLAGGFTPDGYCVEGLGYWNYGFGNFALLSENLWANTGGKIDLLAGPVAAQPALFGLRSEILNGVYLTIADVHPGEKPSPTLMNYLARCFGLDPAPWQGAALAGGLYEKMAFGFLPAELPQISSENSLADFAWRTWFPEGGVLVCRPGNAPQIAFAAAIRGGNNGVNHGHNDVGSFSVVFGTNMVVCDPGGEVYTKRTFSAHRYDSKVLNSFGHAVPMIGGQLQKTGPAACAVVVETNFTAAADSLTFDLRSAYPVRDLEKMQRTFIFTRGEHPSLTVRDEMKCAAPEMFETALVTFGEVKFTGPNTVEITDGGSTVRVTINTQGRVFRRWQEEIDEDVQSRRQPHRIAFRLNSKIAAGVITLGIVPVTK